MTLYLLICNADCLLVEPITAPQKSVFTPLRDSVRGLKRTWHTEEAQRIDGENRSRLAAMSEEEILQEQANLLKTLG